MKNRETFYLTPEELDICQKYSIERKEMKKLIHQALMQLKENSR